MKAVRTPFSGAEVGRLRLELAEGFLHELGHRAIGDGATARLGIHLHLHHHAHHDPLGCCVARIPVNRAAGKIVLYVQA
jgi:hypothetical protein